MYVRWKILFGLGIIFWLSLCFFDAYFVDVVPRRVYSNSDEYQWRTRVTPNEFKMVGREMSHEDDAHSDDNAPFGISILLWNIATFLITIIVCSFSKAALGYVAQYKETKRELDDIEMLRGTSKKNSSKIPVLSSKSSINTLFEDFIDIRTTDKLLASSSHNLSSSSTGVNLTVRPSKSEMSSRLEHQMEKQCVKLRDDMIILQANSLKEHAALSRKLESVTKEKRDLYRQLMMTQKENRAAKQQLEELLAEKALLVKRLDCASREFKVNTKSKKMALARLDESQSIVRNLTQQLEKASYEKQVLDSRINILDVEYKTVKERLIKFEPQLPPDSFTLISDKVETLNRVTNVSMDKSNVHDISQSQKDVQRVQMRLIDLEKSLDRLKMTNWNKQDEYKTSQHSTLVAEESQTDSEVEYASATTQSGVNQPETPLEDPNHDVDNVLAQSDNLTDEQRRKILEPLDSSGDEFSDASKTFDKLLDFQGEDPFERVGNLLKYIKHTSPTKLDSLHSNYITETVNNQNHIEPNRNEEDDTDYWEPPTSRIVSNSPAFQKFLKTMEPPDRIKNRNLKDKYNFF